MGWVGLGRRIFDLPDVGLGTYFRQPNQPNNPLGPGNPSGQPYRAGTLDRTVFIILYSSRRVAREGTATYIPPRFPLGNRDGFYSWDPVPNPSGPWDRVPI